MSLSPSGGWLALLGFGAALLLGVAWAEDRGGVAEPPRAGPLVNERVMAEALASAAAARPPLADEVDPVEARLASRDGETFSHARLASAHLLRFRAYGDLADLEAAEEHLRARAEAAGETPDVLADRAYLHLLRHEFTASLEAARRANRLANGRDPAIQMRLFDAYSATGMDAEAQALLTLPFDSLSVDYLARKARVLDGQGEVERARDLFREIVERVRAYAEPAAVQAWALTELGHFEHHAGDPERSVGRFLEALEQLPGSPAALEGLASLAYGVDRDLDRAALLYRRALEAGGHLDLMPRLATIEEERGRVDEARRLVDGFVTRATVDERHERWYRRPLALTHAESPTTVCRAVEMARADLADRKDAGAWATLAWTLYRSGEVVEADAMARRATAGGAVAPPVAWQAGVIAAAAGDRERAERLLGEALEGASELTVGEVEEARRVLEGGSPEPVPPAPVCDA